MYLPFFADGFENHYIEWGEDDDWSELRGDQGVDAVEQGVVPENQNWIKLEDFTRKREIKYYQINVGSFLWEDILYSTWGLIIKR